MSQMTTEPIQSLSHTYESPFSNRYGSAEMRALFSMQTKYTSWRKIWISLAEAQKELGLPITDAQLDELRQYVDAVDIEKADEIEKELKHDVAAHILAFGLDCPNAKAIIHLGATSCLITDNAELMVMQKALSILEQKLHLLIEKLAQLADRYKDLATLSYTHFQPAQPTTVGKRFTLWLQDFILDAQDLKYRKTNLCFLGIKGATGTQASFLELFDGDHDKVKELERLMAEKLGFDHVFSVSGQTYTRKQDTFLLQLLSGICASAHKLCTDLRLLAHLKEIEESFGKNQVGSSAMPYKRNPMESERVCSLARYVISLSENPVYTSSLQWLERTLDDSANRRLCIPEAFLATDAILDLLVQITSNLTIYEKVIANHLKRELPFLATENILMSLVKKGADRQEMHEKLKQLSHEVSNAIREGGENDLLQKIASDSSIPLSSEELKEIVNVKNFIGRASEQVTEFLKEIGYAKM